MSVETHFGFSFQPLTHMLWKPVWENVLVDGMEAGCRPSSLVLMGETGGWQLTSPGGQAVGGKSFGFMKAWPQRSCVTLGNLLTFSELQSLTCKVGELLYRVLWSLNQSIWDLTRYTVGLQSVGGFTVISYSQAAAAAAKSLQSCPTLCDPIDGSPLGSPIPGILQARILEWVAISFSNAWKWKVKVKSLSHVQLLATPWTAAHQAPPSMGLSRQEYWSGVPLPSRYSQEWDTKWNHCWRWGFLLQLNLIPANALVLQINAPHCLEKESEVTNP